MRAWHQYLSGGTTGRVLFLVGEPGTGKTHMLTTLIIAEAETAGVAVIRNPNFDGQSPITSASQIGGLFDRIMRAREKRTLVALDDFGVISWQAGGAANWEMPKSVLSAIAGLGRESEKLPRNPSSNDLYLIISAAAINECLRRQMDVVFTCRTDQEIGGIRRYLKTYDRVEIQHAKYREQPARLEMRHLQPAPWAA